VPILIKNSTLLQQDECLPSQDVLIKEGKIAAISPVGNISCEDAEIIDASGKLLSPCFVDLHFHGSGEYLIDDGPGTPVIPDSIIQFGKAKVWISETVAQDTTIDWDKGY